MTAAVWPRWRCSAPARPARPTCTSIRRPASAPSGRWACAWWPGSSPSSSRRPTPSDAEDYLRKGLAARDSLRDDPLVSFTLAPHAPYTVSDATLQRIAMLADELDLPIHTHVHETDDEVRRSIAQYGCRPLARLDRLGLVSERLIAVHAVHLDDGEIALLAERGASIAHCPASNLKLGSGIAPIADAAGRRRQPRHRHRRRSQQRPRSTCCRSCGWQRCSPKARPADASALPAPAALEAATLGGAQALGLARPDRIDRSGQGGRPRGLRPLAARNPAALRRDLASGLFGRSGAGQRCLGRRAACCRRETDRRLRMHSRISCRTWAAWQNRCRQVLLTAGAS